VLSDRDYMKDSGYRDPLTVTAKLTIAFVAVFALQCINWAYLHSNAELWFGLSNYGLRRGWVWQLLTFQFLHAGILHLLFNLLSFWWLGRYVESAMGSRRLLLAFSGSGAIGGLLQGALTIFFPKIYAPVMFGASAGVCGLLAIFARLESQSELRLYGILPIKAWTLLLGLGAFSLFFTLVPADQSVAHAAHLGGILTGLGFVKLGWHHDYVPLPWDGLAERLRGLFRRRQPARVLTPRFTATSIPRAEQVTENDADYIAREVDPILEKIAAHGIQSLTARERKILEIAREKVTKR
jgi:membrane associated rhomboid family serine protease